jgi:uncharacterized membrane protein YoaK (UPF0700 family)
MMVAWWRGSFPDTLRDPREVTLVSSRPLRKIALVTDTAPAPEAAADTISFLALGKVFSAFMTGNVAFLGMRASGAASAPEMVSLLASLGAFAVGSYVAARIVTGRSDIWHRNVTVALGVSLFGHVMFVALWLSCAGTPSSDLARVMLAAWAFASGVQSAAVRSLHVEGVISTAATGTILALMADMADMADWHRTGPERRRLVAVLASLFGGAVAGGLLVVHANEFAPLLPLTIAVSVVAIAAHRFGATSAHVSLLSEDAVTDAEPRGRGRR